MAPPPLAASPPPCLVRYIAVVRLSLFPFLSLADATRLLATCRTVREDTESVELLLKISPVASVIFHSNAISSLGCLPSASPSTLQEASCASALSVAGLWENELLRTCYQWHNGRRLAVRLEPFVLPLRSAVQTDADIHDALESVLAGLGGAYAGGVDVPPELSSVAHSDVEKTAVKDADTEEEEDDGLDAFRGLLDSDSDSDDSDWGDSDSDADSELDDDEDGLASEWLEALASSGREPRLHFKVYRPLLRLFSAHSFQPTRWTTVPSPSCQRDAGAWRSHLLVGVAPSRRVLSGVLVKARAY